MKDGNLEVFIDGLTNYFDKTTGTEAKVSTPFLIQDVNKYLSDYTGIIGISGNYKGSVFFTAPKRMIIKLISEIGLMTTRDDKLMDLVGEVSNTIAGNARSVFGDQFMLTTPIVLQGKSEQLRVSSVASIYVIPVVWKGMNAHLIINLNQA
jgi:chemotaxis protein CheX